MITVIFRAKMKEGKEEEALKTMGEMAETVQANEPGALVYLVHRLQDDPSQLIVFECYADAAAFKGHAGTPHMADMRAAFAELFDTTQVKLERLERKGGYSRDS